MTSASEGLHAAALVLAEDIRKVDAGEIRATPEQRAFLMGAKNAFLRQRTAESGGYPVDGTGPGSSDAPETGQIQGMDGGQPQNTGLADRVQRPLDGGRTVSNDEPGRTLDGGKP